MEFGAFLVLWGDLFPNRAELFCCVGAGMGEAENREKKMMMEDERMMEEED